MERKMARCSILHITDIHFGQYDMTGRWPTIKAQLLGDLDYVIEQTGGIDLIAVSGDIANRGLPKEYEAANDLFEALGWHIYERCGSFPFLTVVPGNHDVERPPSKSAAQRVLEDVWDPEVQSAFFSNPEDEERIFAISLFDNYTNWLQKQPLPLATPDYSGVLPGDYSTTITINGIRLGLIGLNTTFRHLSDKFGPGSLTLTSDQIQRACGGDLPRWSAQTDLSIVMTHHPLTWIANADDVRDALFNTATNVRLHLCGHLHLERYTANGLGSTSTYYTHQGQSLFGLELFGGTGEQDRQHGYAVLTVDQTASGFELKIWPRSAQKSATGTWQFEKATTFGLPKGSDSSNALIVNGPPNSPPKEVSKKSHPSPADELTKKGVLSVDYTDQIGRHIAAGDLVLVVGDRTITTSTESWMPFERYRTALWDSINTGLPDTGAANVESLLQIVADRSLKEAEAIVATYLGQPPPEAVSEMRAILRAPWHSVLYLSPLADLEPARDLLEEPGKPRYNIYDGTLAPFRLPPPTTPFILRLATRAPEEGASSLLVNRRAALSDDRTGFAQWHRYARQLVARLPVLFLADSVVSLPLWELIAERATNEASHRPPAFLVSPSLEGHQRASLAIYGVEWLQSEVAPFIAKYAATSRAEIGEGLQRQSRRRAGSKLNTILSLSSIIRNAGVGSRDYLLGRSPTWGDLLGGFAAELSTHERILSTLNASDSGEIVLVAGTAGCGRTTALMQCAIKLFNDGLRIAWIDAAVKQKIGAIVDEVARENYDVVFVDDADIFGGEATRLLEELRGHQTPARRVIAGIRSVRQQLLNGLSRYRVAPTPRVDASGARALSTVLRKQNAVANRRLTGRQIEELLLSDARGELLVGMMKVTYGVPFGERVSSEYAQLSSAEQIMYGCLAVVTSEHESMTVDQLMNSSGEEPRESWRAFSLLRETGLVIQHAGGDERFEVRHRVVAEEVRSLLASTKQLQLAVSRALRALAASAADLRDSSLPDRRAMIRLLNHSYLIGLRLSPTEIRAIYDGVEDLLDDDFHYWLQRGSFEVERGDDAYALHDLTSAMTTPGGERDPKVLTEFGSLRLKLATRVASIEATKLALEAMADLTLVIRQSGLSSPHTFVVLARDGRAWLSKASLGRTQLEELLTDSIKVLKLGARLDNVNLEVASTRIPAIEAFEALLNSVS